MHQYDSGVARSYAAYRPPLHTWILRRALAEQRFALGLDIGCGTGQSAHALAEYCQQIIGTDTSAEMLAQAMPHPGVEYRLTEGDRLPLTSERADIVTLAGVLPYLDQAHLLSELDRVGTPDAKTLVYDFRVDLEPLKHCIGLATSAQRSAYDHAASLENAPGMRTLAKTSEQATFNVDPTQAAHLLLSSHDRYQTLAEMFGTNDPFAATVEKLAASGDNTHLGATTWYALHQRSG